jgi:hypothetical protein
MSYFGGALAVAIEDQKHHRREAVRLRSLAPTITTPAIKARVLEQAQEHAMRAGLVSDGVSVTDRKTFYPADRA